MALVRVVVLLAFIAAIAFFLAFALTRQEKYKRTGLRILAWTLVPLFLFFVALFVQRLLE